MRKLTVHRLFLFQNGLWLWKLYAVLKKKYFGKPAENQEQAEISTVEDFLNSIENQKLYQVLIMVDKLTLQIVEKYGKTVLQDMERAA